MTNIVISGTGLHTPKGSIANKELVAAYNAYSDKFNAENKDDIAAGTVEEMKHSSVEFIEKASGIKSRHLADVEGMVDVENHLAARPMPNLYGDYENPTNQAIMAIDAAKKAMKDANKKPEDIDLIINASSAVQRSIPSMAVEMQHFLGTSGYAFDLQMGCSGATFALSTAYNAIFSGQATTVLVVNPEQLQPLMNYRDRDSHFIFGEVGTAMIIEREETATSDHQFKILDIKLLTKFSYNVRSEWGLAVTQDPEMNNSDNFAFKQKGRSVFKELVPMVCDLIEDQLEKMNYKAADIRRFWLHQANINMNTYATRKLLGRDSTQDEAPIVLDQFGNTGGAGSVIAFHKYHKDLKPGDIGVMCSFGAGYSIGSVMMECVK